MSQNACPHIPTENRAEFFRSLFVVDHEIEPCELHQATLLPLLKLVQNGQPLLRSGRGGSRGHYGR